MNNLTIKTIIKLLKEAREELESFGVDKDPYRLDRVNTSLDGIEATCKAVELVGEE